MYEIALNRQAQRQYEKLTGKDFKKVDESLELLKTTPRPPGVIKLSGNIHRIRVGDWRIIFAIYDKDKLVIIGKIVRRSEDTYNNIKKLF